jgi:hypothetical protein
MNEHSFILPTNCPPLCQGKKCVAGLQRERIHRTANEPNFKLKDKSKIQSNPVSLQGIVPAIAEPQAA